VTKYTLIRLSAHILRPLASIDRTRDLVMFNHIRALQPLVTPQHPALDIPDVVCAVGAPWVQAQHEFRLVDLFRDPRSKVVCITRCANVLAETLRLADGKPPAADDIFPVLVYVILQVCPPYLLSTLQYVEHFGRDMESEHMYWFTQTASATAFIRSMYVSDFLDQVLSSLLPPPSCCVE
jgi:GTPase-activating protein and VPS9 domain-containing protein 1